MMNCEEALHNFAAANEALRCLFGTFCSHSRCKSVSCSIDSLGYGGTISYECPDCDSWGEFNNFTYCNYVGEIRWTRRS